MSKRIIDFLTNLSANNDKVWFDTHRNDFEVAKNELLSIVENVIIELSVFDTTIGTPEAKKCIFRQHRDVRFSKNKQPFKTNMGAFIVKGGKSSSNAGYYVHFEPGQSFVGGGIYAPQPEVLHALRTEIYFNAPTFKSIIYDDNFHKMFGELMDERLVKAPKGFPPDFGEIELLKYKHYVVSRPFNPEEMSTSDIQIFIIETFKNMIEFNQFLNQALVNKE